MCVACLNHLIPDYDGQECIEKVKHCLDVFTSLTKPGYEVVPGKGY